jgi:hypothetical protein
MNSPLRICISSPPDKEKLVAEIFFGSEQWAEINQEQTELQVEFYPRQSGEPWSLKFEDAIAALEQARSKLLGGT